MLDRIDTLSANRMATRPAISIETKLGNAFDNMSRRSTSVDIKRPEVNPETSQRFSNLLSLLPYLDRSQALTAGIGSKPPEKISDLAVRETDLGSDLTGEEWMRRDLAQLLEVKENEN